MKKLLIMLTMLAMGIMLMLCCIGCNNNKAPDGNAPQSQGVAAWDSISGSFTREGSGQFNNATLQMKDLSNHCVLFEFRLMKGSESRDIVDLQNLAFVLAVGEDGIGRYRSPSENNKPFSIDFALSPNGQRVTVTHTGELLISPDGVYNLIDGDPEVSKHSAIALLEHLPTAATSLNHNNGDYTIQYAEDLMEDWFQPVQAVFNDNGVVLARFLIARDFSAVYRVDDDIEPVLIFGTDAPRPVPETMSSAKIQ